MAWLSLIRIAAFAGALLIAQASHAVEAPYETRLLRLAEVLGSLHYLRNLCGEEGAQWREEMVALLSAENPPPERRAKLVASFNHGYRSFSGVYATCTASAAEAIARYMEEGEALAREIAVRFGD